MTDNEIVSKVVSAITKDVKNSECVNMFGIQPTIDVIKMSLIANWQWLSEQVGVNLALEVGNQNRFNELAEQVYVKLRKNSVLAKMRNI